MDLLDFYKEWLDLAEALAAGYTVPYEETMKRCGLCENAKTWGNCSVEVDLEIHAGESLFPFGSTAYQAAQEGQTQHLDIVRLAFVKRRIKELS